jgi:hypothetical protein
VLREAPFAQGLPEAGVQFPAVKLDPAVLVEAVGSPVNVPSSKFLNFALG